MTIYIVLILIGVVVGGLVLGLVQKNEEREPKQFYGRSDLLRYRRNLLVYGIPSIGKTALLHEMMRGVKSAVLIDMQNIGLKHFEIAIRGKDLICLDNCDEPFSDLEDDSREAIEMLCALDGVQIVMSYRTLPKTPVADRLGMRAVRLDGFTLGELQQIVFDHLTTNYDIAQHIMEKTHGHPLLVRLYISQLKDDTDLQALDQQVQKSAESLGRDIAAHLASLPNLHIETIREAGYLTGDGRPTVPIWDNEIKTPLG